MISQQIMLGSFQTILIFFILGNINRSMIHLNIDLSKTSTWMFQWKLSFLILHLAKKAQMKLFSSANFKRHINPSFTVTTFQASKSNIKNIWGWF